MWLLQIPFQSLWLRVFIDILIFLGSVNPKQKRCWSSDLLPRLEATLHNIFVSITKDFSLFKPLTTMGSPYSLYPSVFDYLLFAVKVEHLCYYLLILNRKNHEIQLYVSLIFGNLLFALFTANRIRTDVHVALFFLPSHETTLSFPLSTYVERELIIMTHEQWLNFALIS